MEKGEAENFSACGKCWPIKAKFHGSDAGSAVVVSEYEWSYFGLFQVLRKASPEMDILAIHECTLPIRPSVCSMSDDFFT